MMKKYFLVVNSIFDYGLSPQSIVLYSVLCKFANSDGKCFPSKNTICRCSGIVNQNTYRKNINRLCKQKIVEKTERYAEYGRQTSNLYKIERNKDGFKVPADIFECGLSVYAVCVYLYLCKCADEYLKCYPSQSLIARNCHMSRQKVNECIGELRDKGIIKTYMQKRIYDNGNSVLLYDLDVKRKKDRKKKIRRKQYIFNTGRVCSYVIYLWWQKIGVRPKMYDYGEQMLLYNYRCGQLIDSG